MTRLTSPPRAAESVRRSPSLAGAAAGTLAAVPMLVVMDLLNRTLPGDSEEQRLPPMKVTTRMLEEVGVVDRLPPRGEDVAGFIGHLGYGGMMGAVYGAISRRFPMPPAGGGIVFALAVWILSYVGWLPALSILPAPHHRTLRRNVVIIAAHVVWGLLLGSLTYRFQHRGQRA